MVHGSNRTRHELAEPVLFSATGNDSLLKRMCALRVAVELILNIY